MVINSTQLPRQICRLSIQIPIQTTANGGTNDAAIATHASDADILLYPNAKNAMIHEANAIHRSISVGWVLINISLVSSDNGINRVISIAEIIPIAILLINSHSDFQKSLLFHVVIENDTP